MKRELGKLGQWVRPRVPRGVAAAVCARAAAGSGGLLGRRPAHGSARLT